MLPSSFSRLPSSPHSLVDGVLILKCKSDYNKAFSDTPGLQDKSELLRISWLPLKSPNSLSLNSEFQVYGTTDQAISCFQVNRLCACCAHWNSLSQLLSLAMSVASKGISPCPLPPPFWVCFQCAMYALPAQNYHSVLVVGGTYNLLEGQHIVEAGQWYLRRGRGLLLLCLFVSTFPGPNTLSGT